MPFTKSEFIAKQLPILILQKHRKVANAFYASLLLGVYENRRVKDKQSLMTRLQNIPSEILVDGILDRFAISRATKFGKSKDKSFTIDPYHEDKLLTYLFILLLHINNFTVELVPLSKDLKLKIQDWLVYLELWVLLSKVQLLVKPKLSVFQRVLSVPTR